MGMSQGLLGEFDYEMDATRKTLERVPEGKFDWKPHPKSGTLGWLASHLAELPGWAAITLQQDSFDMAPPGGAPAKTEPARTREELLERFDRSRAEARAAIAATSDAEFGKSWALLQGGKTLFQMPKIAVLRSFVMNHLIHHRAQLGVYLRMNDVPVPAIYGPSADESPF